MHFGRALSNSAILIGTWIALSLVSGCATDRGLHLTTHPAFPPIVPIKDREEIQVTWVRSWRPTIYLRAEFDSDDYDRDKRARLSYSISDRFVSQPRTISISEDEWQKISDALTSLGFWEDGWACAERAYRERSFFYDYDEADGCSEVALLDGASISIAATDSESSKGVRLICPDIEMCEPLGNLPRVMLEIAGLESEL